MTFIQKAIGQGVAILFGATGEIVTEKSGNLNLGIPGIMYRISDKSLEIASLNLIITPLLRYAS